ncbi:MAG: pro-sigmaK processing inhibitor BofA family protein [Oscillospiraceae bacterium]
MDVTMQVLLGLLAVVLFAVIVRVFRTPLALLLKLLVNTLLGFFALYLLQLTAGFTGFAVGLSLWNALTIGILGLPGLGLLLLLQWIL